jgi:hypothetical protein
MSRSRARNCHDQELTLTVWNRAKARRDFVKKAHMPTGCTIDPERAENMASAWIRGERKQSRPRAQKVSSNGLYIQEGNGKSREVEDYQIQVRDKI